VCSLILPVAGCGVSSAFAGNQLRQDLSRWLSPSDPSINYNTTSGVRHKDTALWFIQGSTFVSWKKSTSLLWIHGKRTFYPRSTPSASLTDFHSTAGAGKSVLV